MDLSSAVQRRTTTSWRPTAPRKISHVITGYRPCTFCGSDLDCVEAGKKKNMKQHIASNHTAELSGGNGNLTCTDFLSHLHLLVEVQKSLKAHDYKILPSCTFLSQRYVSLLFFIIYDIPAPWYILS